MLVQAPLSRPATAAATATWLNLIVDTGATKCVLFEDALAHAARTPTPGRRCAGCTAPTLIGTADARIARVPALELRSPRAATSRPLQLSGSRRRGDPQRARAGARLGDAARPSTGCSATRSSSATASSSTIRDRVLWLDPIPGLPGRPALRVLPRRDPARARGTAQVRRDRRRARVAGGAGAASSAATRSSRIDGAPARAAAIWSTLARRLEGAAGQHASRLVVRQGAVERTHRPRPPPSPLARGRRRAAARWCSRPRLFWGTSATLARFVFRDLHVPPLRSSSCGC